MNEIVYHLWQKKILAAQCGFEPGAQTNREFRFWPLEHQAHWARNMVEIAKWARFWSCMHEGYREWLLAVIAADEHPEKNIQVYLKRDRELLVWFGPNCPDCGQSHEFFAGWLDDRFGSRYLRYWLRWHMPRFAEREKRLCEPAKKRLVEADPAGTDLLLAQATNLLLEAWYEELRSFQEEPEKAIPSGGNQSLPVNRGQIARRLKRRAEKNGFWLSVAEDDREWLEIIIQADGTLIVPVLVEDNGRTWTPACPRCGQEHEYHPGYKDRHTIVHKLYPTELVILDIIGHFQPSPCSSKFSTKYRDEIIDPTEEEKAALREIAKKKTWNSSFR